MVDIGTRDGIVEMLDEILKTYIIEKGNNKLISIVTRITEVYVIPILERDNAKKLSRHG